MERLESHGTSGGERSDAVEHCRASIARLSNEVQDASSYIPAYDQRTYSEAIKALSNKLQTIKASFAPRQKFSFKSGPTFTAKKNESAISLNDAAQLANERRREGAGHRSDVSDESSFATTPAELITPAPDAAESSRDATESGTSARAPMTMERIRQFSFSQDTSVKLDNHDGLHILLPSRASHATSSGTLSMLHHCVVDMTAPTSTGQPFASLTLKNIKESLIVCGHVNGPAHLTNVSNSIIVVACRQFRMHESRNCDVYVLTASGPIIEDCAGIRFAPLPDHYMTDEDRQVANKWQHVQDFKWLRSEPSPNWGLLEESQRVKANIWTNVVPGVPGKGAEDILKAVNLPKSK